MERVKKTRRSEPVTAHAESVEDVINTAAGAELSVSAGVASKAEVNTEANARVNVSQVDDDEQSDDPMDGLVQGVPQISRDLPLTVKISRQLHSKLVRSAQDEGVSLEALVQELLAEGATLRAWEIIERKHAMRGSVNTQPSAPMGGNRNFNGNYGNGNNRHAGGNRAGGNSGNVGNGGNSSRHSPGHNNNRGPSSGRVPSNNAWMEDKAAFLEYVRNQEKRRR
jgi:hypothetical protein